MADQELIYDFINRFSDSNMFSDNIKFDYQLSFSERFVSIYCHVKFNYEKIITNNDYISSHDIKSHVYKIKNDIKKYGFLNGLYMSIKRILRCHPWSKQRVDFP